MHEFTLKRELNRISATSCKEINNLKSHEEMLGSVQLFSYKTPLNGNQIDNYHISFIAILYTAALKSSQDWKQSFYPTIRPATF